MKCKTTIRLLFTLTWALLTIPVGAVPTPLPLGHTLTIDCATGNILTRRSTTATGSQAVAARLTMSLDSTGTVLTINFQNIAATPDAVLYAIDLGLPAKFVTVNRMEASLSNLPTGARWHGPTDLAEATNAIGTSTFAAREVIAGRMEEYLPRQRSLSPGFLRTGQSGKVTIKLTLTTAARQKPLLLDPVAYFLVNDPNSPNKRMQIVSTSTARAN